MTYIPMQEAIKDSNTLLLNMVRQLRAILYCLSNMSNLNIKEEDIS